MCNYRRLQLVERAVQQNANHRAQLDYRDLPDIAPLSLISNMALNQDKGTRGKGVRKPTPYYRCLCLQSCSIVNYCDRIVMIYY